MTLLSSANLKVAPIASTNPYDGALNGVGVDPDGATVACDGLSLVAVGPARKDVQFPDVGPRGTPGDHGMVLRPDFIEEVAKIIPKDKRLSLQHVAMTVGTDPSKVEFTTIDKAGRVRRIAEYAKRERFPDWRSVVRKALTPKEGEEVRRVCVGRKALLQALKVLSDACPDEADAPIFLEIGSGVVARARNRQTGQHVIAVAAAMNTGDKWLESDAWETEVLSRGGKTGVKPVRRILKK